LFRIELSFNYKFGGKNSKLEIFPNSQKPPQTLKELESSVLLLQDWKILTKDWKFSPNS